MIKSFLEFLLQVFLFKYRNFIFEIIILICDL